MKIAGQFIRFSIIGAAGFMIDVAVLYLAHDLGLDLYSARIVSFISAATFTWAGNRLFTFRGDLRRGRKMAGEWAVYLAAMTLGGLINYGTYALLIAFSPLFHDHPWMAVAGGTAGGLLVNFLSARKILHAPRA
jgi:putative flippase GtrA